MSNTNTPSHLPQPTGSSKLDSAVTFLRSRACLPLRGLLLLFWLAIFAFGGMAQGKISTLTESDPSFFLPASAQSTRAAQEANNFREDATIPALVVVQNNDESELSDDQMALLGKISTSLPKLKLDADLQLADVSAGPIPVIPNQERTAVLMPIALDKAMMNERTADNDTRISLTISQIRATLATQLSDAGPTGQNLVPYVSGPAGLAADLGGAFAGIDLTLLLVAVIVVFIILIVVYRSIFIPIAVLFTAITALCGAALVVFGLAQANIINLNGQTQGILAILVIGATTDYCLLLIARYREELTLHDHPMTALVVALKGSWEPILASGGTVIAGLLILLISDLSSTSSLGPISSIGIVFAMLAALTLLPGILMIPGKHARALFWPAKIVHYDSRAEAESHGIWHKVARFVERRYRSVWVGTLATLLIFASFAFTFQASGTSATEQFTQTSEAVSGFEVIGREFESGSIQPTIVVIDAEKADQAITELTKLDGVVRVTPQPQEAEQLTGPPPGVAADQQAKPPAGVSGSERDQPATPPKPLIIDGRVLLNLTTAMPAEDKATQEVVGEVRKVVHGIGGNPLVGGPAAESLDTQQTAQRDFTKIVPTVLFVIALMLMVLLRSVVAPLVVLVANLISFGATLGICSIVFYRILDMPGADASVPLYAFVFLIALGIDYTIFLMSRAREESLEIGSRAGMTRAVGVTGGVITSAGIVLAATFAALGIVPLLFMVQLAIIVALGIMIDTLIVRSLLIPGLAYEFGDRMWWPWTARNLAPQAQTTDP
ncbi:MMPL family transporter [Arcanobacterium pinnipediorum]|uniref:MMPL family transporter n=1 Tax=Arcanobacterium pinnipediorum TaxID=1503041 RepID=A0ABY5AHN3_9ACTO|nr:MMPL family transporter [Arcanobacterium pinnipediorum]USR79226.1 MMPL family transporter [Arcanobacterium pinnipediorum]